MIVVVRGPVKKLCPYRNEVDEGTVTVTFSVSHRDDCRELHSLAGYLGSFEGASLSHEDFTRQVHADLAALSVESTWQTAGLTVTCAVPHGRG